LGTPALGCARVRGADHGFSGSKLADIFGGWGQNYCNVMLYRKAKHVFENFRT